MKSLIYTVLLSFTICINVQAQEKSKTDSLVFLKFHSTILNEERKIVVHLPLKYVDEPEKKYPVIYVLDAGKLDFDI